MNVLAGRMPNFCVELTSSGGLRPPPLAAHARRYAAKGRRVEQPSMGDAARHLLKSFDALSEADRREVLEQLLRREAELPHSFPSDDELVRAADQVFQELDRREAKG